jgi:hypothetical protein
MHEIEPERERAENMKNIHRTTGFSLSSIDKEVRVVTVNPPTRAA